jgi:glycerol-3-phosphate cytidylyltransferase
MKKNKKILVDMTCSIIHHGHIRLLKKAFKYGSVIIALTSDKDVVKYKKFKPALNFQQRKEILSSIKYVSKVIKSSYFITESFLIKHDIDYLVHGNDNKNKIPKKYLKIFEKTKNISSTILRKI